MTTWLDFAKPKGVYTSPVYDISADYDYYLTNILMDYDMVSSNSNLKVQIKLTNDNGTTWTDWIDLIGNAIDLFKDYNSTLDTKFRYRVVMYADDIPSSPIFKSFKMDFKGSIVIYNTGDLIYRPEVWIKKINGSGDVELKNETNGQIMKFTGLSNNETVYIDCENEDIVTDNVLVGHRYDDHNNVFLELGVGRNILTGEGDFEIDFRFEFKTLQG